MTDTVTTIHERASAGNFDQPKPLSEPEIRSLVEEATQAPSSARDEAIRSGSLAAMTLMLAARAEVSSVDP